MDDKAIQAEIDAAALELAKANLRLALARLSRNSARLSLGAPCSGCVGLKAQLKAERERYVRDVFGLNNEGDPIGGDPAGGYHNDLAAAVANNVLLVDLLWRSLPYVKSSGPQHFAPLEVRAALVREIESVIAKNGGATDGQESRSLPNA